MPRTPKQTSPDFQVELALTLMTRTLDTIERMKKLGTPKKEQREKMKAALTAAIEDTFTKLESGGTFKF